ncbi:ABC transporter ATP-binding protein [Uliginosibacterium sp. H3]|uniref:ABC transporter ATP-binding protein n=1 Tax=Uliginosibacterium silvisoli TaxID=3114758 RepID=A0ABU6K890_9RHOO|nr:ABC transporter ATP-binding protein [Uliginosibacterium sp. H3]
MNSAAQLAGRCIDIESVGKSFSGVRALHDIDLHVAPGEFLALLGPSGCGKTTLLRALAGLLTPDEGVVRFGDETIVDTTRRIFVPAERRKLGMVFQDYALWPHMRVRDNIAFPLVARSVAPALRQERVDLALARTALTALADRFPGELSGGQQQRVALARAIVDDTSILLFDEPLSNLDASLRDTLGREIATLVRDCGSTAIYVTHDQNEALSLSDRIAVMREGRIVQLGSPEEVYRAPADPWVAAFLKSGNLLGGHTHDGTFTLHGSEERLALDNTTGSGPQRAASLLLPHAAISVSAAPADAHLCVVSTAFRGDRYEVTARWGRHAGAPTLQFWHDRALAPGELVAAAIDRSRVRLYDTPPTAN